MLPQVIIRDNLPLTKLVENIALNSLLLADIHNTTRGRHAHLSAYDSCWVLPAVDILFTRVHAVQDMPLLLDKRGPYEASVVSAVFDAVDLAANTVSLLEENPYHAFFESIKRALKSFV
jgi:hypothetical protein